MKIEAAVLDVLSNAQTSGNGLVLPGQLDRKMYEKVNKVLDAAGGKWNRKAKAHLFEGDAAEIMDAVILTGEVTVQKDEFDFFPTPKAVVERLIDLAEIAPGMTVLEPSAGRGAIALDLLKLTHFVQAIEVDPKNAEYLRGLMGMDRVKEADFLTVDPRPIFDRVVMNPPFSLRADIRHVRHAFRFLRTGGRLVSVMSAGVEFRTDRLGTEFRDLVKASDGFIERLPEGSFKESGTGVNTVIVVMEAAGAARALLAMEVAAA